MRSATIRKVGGTVGPVPAGPDTSRLSPADCVAALRSYPRRARQAVAAATDGDDVDALAAVAGPDGRTAVEHLDGAARALEMLGEAIRSVLVQDDPSLLPAVVDESARVSAVEGTTGDVHAALEHLESAATAVAGVADGDAGGAEGWDRTGTVAGSGAAVSALDLLREAVRTGAVGLRGTDAALAAARR